MTRYSLKNRVVSHTTKLNLVTPFEQSSRKHSDPCSPGIITRKRKGGNEIDLLAHYRLFLHTILSTTPV